MTWPEPKPGLVIRYSYLWKEEAASGREEGRKDGPCAIILAVQNEEGDFQVYVLPITHSPPSSDEDGVEIPVLTKSRLGLDSERSWVLVTEANEFLWPGPDLRFLPGRGPETAVYGMLPPKLFRLIRDRFLAKAKARRASVVPRSK